MFMQEARTLFKGLTSSCLMLRNFSCSGCTEKSQSETMDCNIELNLRVCFVDIAASIATAQP